MECVAGCQSNPFIRPTGQVRFSRFRQPMMTRLVSFWHASQQALVQFSLPSWVAIQRCNLMVLQTTSCKGNMEVKRNRNFQLAAGPEDDLMRRLERRPWCPKCPVDLWQTHEQGRVCVKLGNWTPPKCSSSLLHPNMVTRRLH